MTAKCNPADAAQACRLIKNTIISICPNPGGEIDSELKRLEGVPQRAVDSQIHPGFSSHGGWNSNRESIKQSLLGWNTVEKKKKKRNKPGTCAVSDVFSFSLVLPSQLAPAV